MPHAVDGWTVERGAGGDDAEYSAGATLSSDDGGDGVWTEMDRGNAARGRGSLPAVLCIGGIAGEVAAADADLRGCAGCADSDSRVGRASSAGGGDSGVHRGGDGSERLSQHQP